MSCQNHAKIFLAFNVNTAFDLEFFYQETLKPDITSICILSKGITITTRLPAIS